MEREALEARSSKELHDRALEVARHRMDVGFLWSLLKALPVAHAATGNLKEADVDIASMSSLLTDVADTGEGEVADALRPLYIDYLEKHG